MIRVSVALSSSPNIARPRMSLRILTDANKVARAKQLKLERIFADALKALNKNKELVKKLNKK
ncbi:hypothetical protein BKA70DRAFT_1423711 [Coprinopsis sp. MPI-PUGE-AT-0042]|nr:hypothetical protein BKA70DRAFT_1423711 [Coprinopsis sp. MPI-PUGE-AT-0042]